MVAFRAVQPEELLKQARSCLERAYAPYSKYRVAAAVVDERGRTFTGVNVENASYGLTICAERAAIFAAVSGGARRITAVAITAEKSQPARPCGACRQVMVEFCGADAPVYSDVGAGRDPVVWTVGDLLPDAFAPTDLVNKAQGTL